MEVNLCQVGYLRERYRTILSYTGLIVALCGVLILAPMISFLAWPGDARQAWGFIVPGLLMGGGGLTTWRLLRPKTDPVLSVPEGGVIILLSWLLVCLFSAWPFVAVTGLGFTQALFESVSGWTTTGLSVVDVTHACHAILLWRSIMQLAGGAGFAIIMLSALTGPTGPALSVAEGREQLVPHVRQSAKLVLLIYSGCTVAGTIALRLAGMDWFDAVNHAFATVSTGGFSTRVESIGYWNSTAVEAVTVPLMLLSNLSFISAWLLLRARVRAVTRNGEVRLMMVVLPLCIALLFFLTTRSLYPSLGKGLRVAIFQAVTALTTTGFSTVGYGDWNSVGWLVLIVLMLIGGGTCSTAGGIKQYRVYLLWKSLVWQLHRSLLPRTAVTENPAWEAERRVFVTDTRLRQIGAFVFLYLLTFVCGTAVLAAYGYGLKEALFEFASAVGTVGLSVGVTSPSAPSGVLWTEIAGMFMGRLEFFVVLTSVARLIRDARTMVHAPAK